MPRVKFLVPKPQLGNASAPEAPASGRTPVTGSQGFPGKCVPKQGLGNEKSEKKRHVADMPLLIGKDTRRSCFASGFAFMPLYHRRLRASFPFSSFPSPGLGTRLRPKPRLRVVLPSREAGASPASAFPSRGLGTRNQKKKGMSPTCPCLSGRIRGGAVLRLALRLCRSITEGSGLPFRFSSSHSSSRRTDSMMISIVLTA